MLRMMIVEDEKWEREGLADFLDWNSLGIELSAVACDGFEGIEKAKLIKPDIIITDIKMPGMDGLKMSGRIREFLPDVRIIILTGYDDFRLAKEAIKISADAYILKPVEEAEMLEVIGKITAECNEAINKRNEEEKLRAMLNETTAAARRELLHRVLRERAPDETVSHVVSSGFIPLYGYFSVLAAAAGRDDPESPEVLSQIDPEKADAELKPVLSEKGIDFSAVLSDDDGVLLIIAGWNATGGDRLLEAAGAVAGYIGGSAAVGLGKTTNDINNLHICCSQAKEALHHTLFWGCRNIAVYSDIEAMQQENALKIPEFLSTGNSMTKQLMRSLTAADTERTDELLDGLFRFIHDSKWVDRSIIINFLYGLLNEAALLFRNLELPEQEDGAAGAAILDLPDIQSITLFVRRFLEKLQNTVKSVRTNTDEYVLKRVQQIISEKYMQDINIRTIAADVYLSPNYLGSIFKKCTGSSLNDYLCRYRLEKAREMLLLPTNKVSCVARAVGIPNVSYFCTLFKDMFGIAPGEYQEINSRSGAK